jgi:hypothetical protein
MSSTWIRGSQVGLDSYDSGSLTDQVSDQLLLEAGQVGDTLDAEALDAHRVPDMSRELSAGGLHTTYRFGMYVSRVVQR